MTPGRRTPATEGKDDKPRDVRSSARHVIERKRSRPQRPEMSARIYVGAGRQAGIRPGDLVGAITGEAGVDSRALGAIEIADRFSIVEVPEELAKKIITALRATKIRGQKVIVRRHEETKAASEMASSTMVSQRGTNRHHKRRDVSF